MPQSRTRLLTSVTNRYPRRTVQPALPVRHRRNNTARIDLCDLPDGVGSLKHCGPRCVSVYRTGRRAIHHNVMISVAYFCWPKVLGWKVFASLVGTYRGISYAFFLCNSVFKGCGISTSHGDLEYHLLHSTLVLGNHNTSSPIGELPGNPPAISFLLVAKPLPDRLLK